MNNYSKGVPVRAAVVGATGYAGRELLGLLARHPGVELAAVMASSRQTTALRLEEIAPAWRGRAELSVTAASAAALAEAGPDFVFLATPPEISREWVEGLRAAAPAIRVVDLSGAYRFTDEAVYGWPEANRAAIQNAALVANPGCYATAALVALAPLLAAGAIEPGGIICDAKSGASGAGRGLRDDLHFVELEGNCKAYSLFTHRHAPEIARHAGMDAAAAASFIFTPHLLPTSRGILATTYVQLRDGAALDAVYSGAYASELFIRLRRDRPPEINDVAHTNFCDLGWSVRGRQAIVVSCLDNLVKGAAGQALQNFNLMSGWPEATALL